MVRVTIQRTSAHGSAPVQDDEDDSPVKEVSPIKPKKPSIRAARAKKDEPKEPPKDWTMAEETALCQAWCDVSEYNIDGNCMKSKGFWDAVIRKRIRMWKRPNNFDMGRDRAKAKKKAADSSRGGSFILVDLDEPKEPPKDWTMAEETALCQAGCDVSEYNIDGNCMKSKGFWDAVI
nr:hypothetical protein [Tanacetum cinerariifolium]